MGPQPPSFEAHPGGMRIHYPDGKWIDVSYSNLFGKNWQSLAASLYCSANTGAPPPITGTPTPTPTPTPRPPFTGGFTPKPPPTPRPPGSSPVSP